MIKYAANVIEIVKKEPIVFTVCIKLEIYLMKM